MRFLLTISLSLWLVAAQAESVRMLVQNSPLAGSQFYALAFCFVIIFRGM